MFGHALGISILEQKIHDKPLVYLDSAASAKKPKAVLDSLHAAYAETYAIASRPSYGSELSTDKYEAVRHKAAGF